MPTATLEADTNISDDTAVLAPLPAEAEARLMDPAELIIGHNVRPEDQIDLDAYPQQVDSIRRLGVVDPILAECGPDGQVVVVDGQVRALIARDLGLTRVPVYIRPVELDLDHPERQITRTIDQINLNDRRIELTDSARAAGVAYMLDLGATVTRIAQDLQADTASIRRAATIARSATAATLLDDRSWSLDQLEVLAGYEHLGDTDAVQRLSESRWNFDYRARLIAADRQQRRDRLTAALRYAATGHPILSVDSVDLDPEVYVAVDDLVDADGEPVSGEQIEADPARWPVALDLVEDAELYDPDTGLGVDPDSVDFDATTALDEPRDGLRRFHGLAYRDGWIPGYQLRTDQLDALGLQRRVHATATVGEGTGAVSDAAHGAAGQAAAAEQARTERRRVIELNKRGAAAKERRVEFLRRVLALRTPPPGAAEFVAWSLAHDATLLSGTRARSLAQDLLGADTRAALTDKADNAAGGRAHVITLGLVLAAHESSIEKDFWRSHHPYATARPRYLRLLAQIGQHLHRRQRNSDQTEPFTLVDVELAATGDLDYTLIPLDPHAPIPAIQSTEDPSRVAEPTEHGAVREDSEESGELADAA
ncbi:hypothetical protein ACWEVD_00450 [Nocardia thailandica]